MSAVCNDIQPVLKAVCVTYSGCSCSWVVNILISYIQSAPVFIEHLCLKKLPVSYVQCDTTHVMSTAFTLWVGTVWNCHMYTRWAHVRELLMSTSRGCRTRSIDLLPIRSLIKLLVSALVKAFRHSLGDFWTQHHRFSGGGAFITETLKLLSLNDS